MKIRELTEADVTDIQMDQNSPLLKNGFNRPAVNATSVDPVLRRALIKLAQGSRMQRVEAQKAIEAFVSVIQMEPSKATAALRRLKTLYAQASKTK